MVIIMALVVVEPTFPALASFLCYLKVNKGPRCKRMRLAGTCVYTTAEFPLPQGGTISCARIRAMVAEVTLSELSGYIYHLEISNLFFIDVKIGLGQRCYRVKTLKGHLGRRGGGGV